MKHLFLLFILSAAPLALAELPMHYAETARSQLLMAQLELGDHPEGAREAFATARLALSDLPLPSDLLTEPLAKIEQAIETADPTKLAAARATLWTSLLKAGYGQVEAALEAGDIEAAKRWLSLREFRQATRLSLPDSDATLALEALSEGEITPQEALVTVRHDLLDTYQARLAGALSDVAAAGRRGFATRQAEAAALAEGYFAILEPAFLEQRGPAATQEAKAAFRNLVIAQDEAALKRVETVLQGFRAAPLTAEEQQRRAGLLLRFTSLIPVEYARGVRGGRVSSDLEIREAAAFQKGAAAAFADLEPLLELRDPLKTQQVDALLKGLEQSLNAAAQRRSVADPEEIRAQNEALTSILKEVMPTDWQKRNTAADFNVIREALGQMETAVRQGQYDAAASARLEAYAILESGPEPQLTAFAPRFVPKLEKLFWYGQGEFKGLAYLLEHHAPLAEIQASRAALSATLAEAEAALEGDKAPGSVATNAAIIVFREGLEAVVILASLMASLKGPSTRRFRRAMWAGAWAALFASVVTWFVMRGALLVFAGFGEKLEAVVSLIAIGVLILITNWFFHDTYWTDWMASFHKKKGKLLQSGVGAFVGLAALGFVSIYREGFETALFLQSLALSASAVTVLVGTVVGLGATFLIGFVIFQVQTKLPYKKMFVGTAALIGAVLLVMVGHTAHSLQVVGWLPTHPLRFIEFPFWSGMWFGLYATWEGLLLQALAAVFVIGSYVLAEHLKGRSRLRKVRAQGGGQRSSLEAG